jgi:hypothetical protein
VELIGAGLPRTGTSTLREVLVRLGFGPCCHTSELVGYPERIGWWTEAFRGERPIDLRAALAGFRSTTDAPSCFYWRELLAEFPAAKVILTERDPHAWFMSMTKTVLRQDLFADRSDSDGAGGSADARGSVLRGLHELAEAMHDAVFGQRRDEEWLTGLFARHNAAVRREVPADRLLVYEVSQGWEPLCAFLGVPVPDERFPWLNDSAEFVARLQRHRRDVATG